MKFSLAFAIVLFACGLEGSSLDSSPYALTAHLVKRSPQVQGAHENSQYYDQWILQHTKMKTIYELLKQSMHFNTFIRFILCSFILR